MTSIIKLNVFSGAMDESHPCYILQVDDIRLLLDCGWDECFNQNFIKELSKHVNHIDAVLLSHPDTTHLGALPYLVGKCGLSCPIYATIPVYKMGQMFMYDLYQSRYNNENFTLFNLDDVDAAFDKIIQLKYNQTEILRGKCHSLRVIPIPAGHMIGGTMWKIFKIGEEEIIYAVDFNHKKERHLNGCNFGRIQRPSLLITNSFNSGFQQERRRERDEKLMTCILQTLSNNGNVLIAIDTAGRVLEIAHMLDQFWGNKNSGLKNHSLCFLSNVSYNVIEFAKSQIEWMSDKLLKTFESVRYNPFHFKYLKPCHSLSDINKGCSASKVVLASMPDLECGFSRTLCLEWLSDPSNCIILTNKSSRGTLARHLIELASNQKTIHVEIKRRERLTDGELIKFRKENRPQSTEMDSSDSDEVRIMGDISKNHDFVVKAENNRNKKYKSFINRSCSLYPANDVKKKYDEYGEIITISDYVKESKEQSRVEEKIVEDIFDVVEHPTKCVTIDKEIEIKATVKFIEFDGRSDGESVQELIAGTHARSVILVRAPANETGKLAEYLRQWTNAEIFTPSKGEIVDVTCEAHIFQVRLTDSLVSSLDLQPVDQSSAEVAWVDGVIATCSKSSNSQRKSYGGQETMDVDNLNTENSAEHIDLLTLQPVCDNSEVVSHPTIFINEVKLSDLKRIIAKNGIDCEFSGGALFCASRSVVIRRNSRRNISIEGYLSEKYYKVRTLLYGNFAVL